MFQEHMLGPKTSTAIENGKKKSKFRTTKTKIYCTTTPMVWRKKNLERYVKKVGWVRIYASTKSLQMEMEG